MRLEKQKIRQISLFVAALWAGFLLLGFLAAFLVGWQQAVGAVQNLSFMAVMGILVASGVNSAVRCVRFIVWGRWLGLKVPVWRQVFYYTAGFAFAPTPGKVGTVVRSWLLKKHHNIPYRKTLPMVVVEQINDLVAVLFVLFLCVGEFTSHGWFLGYIVALVALVAAAFFWPQGLVWGVKSLFVLSGRRFPRFFAGVLKMLRTTRVLFNPAVFGAGLVLGLVGWGLVAIAMWGLVVQSGVEVGMAEGVFGIVFSGLVGVLSMLPGGVGSTELTLFGFLTMWGASGAVAVALVGTMRLTTLWFGVALGALVLPFVMPHKRAAANKG